MDEWASVKCFHELCTMKSEHVAACFVWKDCLQSNFSAVTQCRWLTWTHHSCVSTSVTSTKLCLQKQFYSLCLHFRNLRLRTLHSQHSSHWHRSWKGRAFTQPARSGWDSRPSSRHPCPRGTARRSAELGRRWLDSKLANSTGGVAPF